MILFVCTGNTCRSPMAAALARLHGIEADSAGLSVWPDQGASLQAQRVMAAFGIDLSRHRAKPVSAELLKKADAVYVMSESHAAQLLFRFPEAAEKIHVFSPPIPDPYGRDEAAYRQCAQSLLAAITQLHLIAPWQKDGKTI